MKSEKPSFEKDLWGQYNKLHERLKKKKSYIKNLQKSLETIYDSLKDLGNKVFGITKIEDSSFINSLIERIDNICTKNSYYNIKYSYNIFNH